MRQKILLFLIAPVLILGVYSQPRKAMAQEVIFSSSVKILLTMATDEGASIDYVEFGHSTPQMVKPATVMFNKVTIKGSKPSVQTGDECAFSVSIPPHFMNSAEFNPLSVRLNGKMLFVNDVFIADLQYCLTDPNNSRVLVMAEGETEFLGPQDYIVDQNSDPNQGPRIDIRIGASITDENGKTKTATITQFTLSASPKIKFSGS